MNNFTNSKKYFCIKTGCLILSGIMLLSSNLFGQRRDGIITVDSLEFYCETGIDFFYKGHTDSALYYYGQALEMLKQTGADDKKDSLQIEIYNSIGQINYSMGKYDLALDHYFRALETAEKNNRHNQTKTIYINVANTYFVMSNDMQAESYYLQAENLSHKLNDSVSMADAWRGLCRISINREAYDTALEYGEKSLRVLLAFPDVPAHTMMNANQMLAYVWLKIPDYGNAMEYAQKSVDYARQTGLPSFLSAALYLLSHCKLKQGMYSESEEIAFEALAIDTTVSYSNFELYANIALANIWMGNPEKSVEYFEKTTNAIRAFSNKNYQSSLTEMEVKYETEKKEMRITSLEEEKRLISWLFITGGGLLLLGLIAFFFLWRWTIQKRRLAEQQRQLAEQQVRQLEQEKQLVATQAVFDGEVKERSRLARDLHDGLGGKLTCMKLNLQELNQNAGFDDDKAGQYNAIMDILDDTVREMRRVSHNLMPETLSRSGLKTAVDDFCRSMSPKIVFSYYGDESRLDMKLEALIYRCIHELVNNALKYANASQIMVQIIREADSVAFTVQDNGCGFDAVAETEGMGLQSIRARVESLGGEMQIDSTMGEGTEINLEIRV